MFKGRNLDIRARDIMIPRGMDITRVKKNNCNVKAVPSNNEGSRLSKYCMVFLSYHWWILKHIFILKKDAVA